MRRATELPGEEDGQLDGILTSSGSADASADRDGRTTTDGTRVLDSARGTDALKGRPSTTSVRTTITASAAPRQRVVGRDVTITGKLTADGAGIADAQ
jgi:hypothetical protein